MVKKSSMKHFGCLFFDNMRKKKTLNQIVVVILVVVLVLESKGPNIYINDDISINC